MKAPLKFVVLRADAFRAVYHKAFKELKLETEADKKTFLDELRKVQSAVERALRRNWKKVDDFEVDDDFLYCYHTCGGIYSDRIFCKAYVTTIRDALQSVDSHGRWTYHTACEILVNPGAKTTGEAVEIRGEFFVRSGTCYINGTEMKRKWRTQLGCDE